MSEEKVAPKPIAQVLVDVSKEVGAVKKDGHNRQQNFIFRGIDAVVNAVHPALVKHGVFLQPEVLDAVYSTATTNNGKIVNVVRIRYRLTFHGPAGDSISVTVWGEANDHGDKATAKAHSVALRTALLQPLCLPTDEKDPDEDSYIHEAPQAPQGPTEEQKAQYQALSAKLQEATTSEVVAQIVEEAEKVPCVEPLRPQLVNHLLRLVPILQEVEGLRGLWQVAERAGVFESVKDAILARVQELNGAGDGVQ